MELSLRLVAGNLSEMVTPVITAGIAVLEETLLLVVGVVGLVGGQSSSRFARFRASSLANTDMMVLNPCVDLAASFS